MKNLAGDRECDRTIVHELECAEIQQVHLDRPSGELPSRVRGRLGPIAFLRSWTCWIAEGPVPLAVALDLYEDRISRQDVRLQGLGDSRPPEAPWVRWYTGEGARVYTTEQRAEFALMSAKWPRLVDAIPPTVFHDDPATVGARAYVDLYHIDSEKGLRSFTRTLRRHGIDRLARPVWWEWHHPPMADGNGAMIAIAGTSAPATERAGLWDGDTQEMALDD